MIIKDRRPEQQHAAGENPSGHRLTLARRTRTVAAKLGLLVTLGVTSVVMLASAPTAGATSLRANLTFECFANGSYSYVRVDKPQVNEDGFRTAYNAMIDQWNGSRYVPIISTPTYTFTDSVFGQLAEQSPWYYVAPNRWYAVAYVIGSNDGLGVHSYWAYSFFKGNGETCHT